MNPESKFMSIVWYKYMKYRKTMYVSIVYSKYSKFLYVSMNLYFHPEK